MPKIGLTLATSCKSTKQWISKSLQKQQIQQIAAKAADLANRCKSSRFSGESLQKQQIKQSLQEQQFQRVTARGAGPASITALNLKIYQIFSY
jgi:hypothetical protein